MNSGNVREDGTPCPNSPLGCVYSRPADRKDDFTNVTSRIGATYALTNDHIVYASIARGYRAPDTSELYRLQRQQTIAELDSERIDSVELGVRGREICNTSRRPELSDPSGQHQLSDG